MTARTEQKKGAGTFGPRLAFFLRLYRRIQQIRYASWSILFKNQDRRRDDCRPEAAPVSDGRLGDVGSADDLVRDAVDFLFLVPAFIGVEIDVEGGGEHFGGKLLGVFAGLFLGFAEAVVLAEVAVGVAVAGNGYADARCYEAMRFASRVFGDDGEDDFAGIEVLQTFFARDEFCLRREDGRDADQVLRRDAGVAEGQFKGGEAFLVFAYTFGKEQPLRDHAFSQFLFLR